MTLASVSTLRTCHTSSSASTVQTARVHARVLDWDSLSPIPPSNSSAVTSPLRVLPARAVPSVSAFPLPETRHGEINEFLSYSIRFLNGSPPQFVIWQKHCQDCTDEPGQDIL